MTNETTDVIRSSGTPIDRSWQETFAPDLEMRHRARVESVRVHEIEHARANSMFRCPICFGYPEAVLS